VSGGHVINSHDRTQTESELRPKLGARKPSRSMQICGALLLMSDFVASWSEGLSWGVRMWPSTFGLGPLNS
jgi:hypothetical protein